ncbi:helix-turn-helix domain-containing protein [Brevibacillus migulae]|uniref:helix-turn-helix domain-containing protein n=1 Tax=Brevibacillus migulae TaxID=1644114 RepID=UPI0014304F09|nr:helix-turn-helix domain-containing protein [Brevibacillus migulae]
MNNHVGLMRHMDFYQVGKYIRFLRKSMGMSQAELASGICTQAQISKIEKGEVYPLATTLYLIAKKLDVDINFFFEVGNSPRLDYTREVYELIRFYVDKRDYQTVWQIVKVEKRNPLFHSLTAQQFLKWHEGICCYHIEKNKEVALELLQEALAMTKSSMKVSYTEREIEILNSIGVIYFEESEYQKATEYFEIALKEHKKKTEAWNNHGIIIRILYNYAKALTRLDQFEESISMCENGIRMCVKHETMYTLGDLFYHKGFNYMCMSRYASAILEMQKAKTIFEIQQNEDFLDFIDEKLSELSQRLKSEE